MANQVDTGTAAGEALLAPVGPQLAADQVTKQAYENQLGLNQKETSLQNTYQQTMAGYQSQDIGLQGQSIGIQQQGLAAQKQLGQQQQGIELQQYGLQQQQFPEQQQQETLRNWQAQGQQNANVALSGVVNGQGNNLGQAATTLQHGWNVADINRAQQQAVLGQQSEVAGYQAQFGGGAYGQGDIGRSAQNLQIMAARNGISAQELTDQLNQGIAQNNLQGKVTTQQLLGQIGSLEAGDIQVAGGALAPLAYGQDINPLAGG